MLTPESITTYQRTCNSAAGYCAACKVKLHPFETHVCDNCAVELYPDPNSSMFEEDDDEEAEKAVQES